MTAFLITVRQLTVLSVLFLIGYYIKKKNYIDDGAVKGLSFLLLTVSTPATVFVSLQIGYSPERIKLGALMVFCYALVMFAGYFVSLICAKALKIEGREKLIWLAGGATFNCLFIGGPIAVALFGEIAMFFLCFGMLGWNFVTYSFVVGIFSGKSEGGAVSELKRIFATPAVIVCFISFAAFALQIKTPFVILKPVEYLSQMTTPLSMLLLGVFVSKSRIKDIFMGKNVYIFSFIRLIVVPVVCIPLCLLLIENPEARNTVLIGTAMPVATIIPVFAETYGGCGEEGSKYCIVTTILSLISLPVVSLILFAL